MSSTVNPISLKIVCVQATIDDRHYGVLYLGDDGHGNQYFKTLLNGKWVSSIMWRPREKKFGPIKWSPFARNKGLSESFVWPNEVIKKMERKLTESSIYRMVAMD